MDLEEARRILGQEYAPIDPTLVTVHLYGLELRPSQLPSTGDLVEVEWLHWFSEQGILDHVRSAGLCLGCWWNHGLSRNVLVIQEEDGIIDIGLDYIDELRVVAAFRESGGMSQ